MTDNTVIERIKQQYECAAERYDGDKSHAALAAKLLELCNLQPGQNLLDIASGTGQVALPAAKAVAPSGMIVAMDLSDAMLEQSKRKAVAEGLQNIQWYCGDMENLDAQLPAALKGQFDAATCSAAILFLQRPQQTLQSWRRWLKPGGKLAFNAFAPPPIEDLAAFFKLAPQFGYDREFDPSEALGSPQLLTSALQAAGYRDVQVTVEEKVRWMPADDPATHAERMWNVALNNNPFTSVHSDPGTEEEKGRLRAFREAYIAAVVADVQAKARFDATQRRVSSRITMLHTVAIA